MLEGFDAAELSSVEIWALGVSRFGWHPEEPPTDMTRESMAYRFYVDTKYRNWDDRLGYDELRGLGDTEDE